MELKMLTGLCGPDVSLTRGDSHTCDDDFEGVRLVRAGFAEPKDPEAFAKAAAAYDQAMADQAASSDAAADAPADDDDASKVAVVAPNAPDDAPATPKPASARAKARS